MRTPARLVLACAAAALASPSHAQIGPDDVVVSSFSLQMFYNGDGGLWIVDSTTGVITPISGLGPDLTGAGGSPIAPTGASCVLVGPASELYVGEVGPQGTAIDLHVITLNGSSVASDAKFTVGTVGPSPGGGGINQMALLPTGEILVGVFLEGGTGPLAGHDLGIVDPTTGQVTPVTAITGQTAATNALCLDVDCQTAYFAVANAGGTSNLFSVPIPGGGQATLLATLCANVSNLHLDVARDRLIATGLSGACAGELIAIDLGTFATSTCASGTPWINACAPDGAGGLFLVGGSSSSPLFAAGVPPQCATTPLTSGPVGGWGLASGLDTLYRASCHSWQIGERYCTPAVPNSTGASARIGAFGRTAVAANDVVVRAGSLPVNAAGYLIVSDTQGFTPLAGGSSGNLCLGGMIGRYVGPGEVQYSGAGGTYAIRLDLSAIPQPTGFVSTTPGSTWNFTWWHRDVGPAGTATSNFTDGLSIRFD